MDFPMVELHVHLDGGANNYHTTFELLKGKNLPLPGDGSYQTFLDTFNDPGIPILVLFTMVLSAIQSDLSAIERISYELCKSQSEQGVIYTEARYTPHYFLKLDDKRELIDEGIPLKSVIEAVNRGIAKGEKEFNVIVRTILSCRRGKLDWCREILELVTEYKDKGVVGIDMSGDVLEPNQAVFSDESRNYENAFIEVFQTAAERGILRTVHTGASGPTSNILKAVDLLKANRVGHGYLVVENEELYQYCLSKRVHFETCPRKLKSIKIETLNKEGKTVSPILRMAQDGMSFSINSDDPSIYNSTLKDNYKLAAAFGLTEAQLKYSNIDAMKSSFAEAPVKEEILKKLYKAYEKDMVHHLAPFLSFQHALLPVILF